MVRQTRRVTSVARRVSLFLSLAAQIDRNSPAERLKQHRTPIRHADGEWVIPDCGRSTVLFPWLTVRERNADRRNSARLASVIAWRLVRSARRHWEKLNSVTAVAKVAKDTGL